MAKSGRARRRNGESRGWPRISLTLNPGCTRLQKSAGIAVDLRAAGA